MSEVADGPETNVMGRRSRMTSSDESRHRLGYELYDLGLIDDADMEVRNERQGSASLCRPRTENDRARLGDRDGAAGENAVELVELGR